MLPLISNVDPFIGVDGPGGCLCGPYLPWSLVRLGPDTLPPHSTNGYHSDSPILRFSHTHVSGTGGLGRYGNIGVTPLLGKDRLGTDGYDRENETASPGYYSVTLRPAGIQAELTSTARAGYHRYGFPSGGNAMLLLDAGSILNPWASPDDPNGCPPVCLGGFIEKISDHEVVGRGDFQGGWGHTHPYSVFFYARAPQIIRFFNAANQQAFNSSNLHASGPGSRAILNFLHVREVELQVGISYASIANARSSVQREIGAAGFDEIKGRAEAVWEEMLGSIKVEGGATDQRKLFYTLFTRLVCMPSDLGVNDEFASWHSDVRHFTDYYCLWDSVRNANSLITLIAPDREVEMLNCLLDIADKTGWLPDSWIAGHSAMIQGGSSADILLCEAALKGLPGIDYENALRQMCKNNEVEPSDPYTQGRYLRDYRDLGFVSTNVKKNCVSRHLEYAYQDWCISRLAAKLGHLELAERYKQSSNKVWNLWRDDLRQFAPKRPDGRWVEPFDPASMLPDSWNDPYFYEGNSWQWSFNVQHDFAGLAQRHGGAEGFMRHLDAFFDAGYYHSKETILHVPWLYHYAGRPDRSVERVRWAMDTFFNTTRNGLADNEDMGCQSAFYMGSAMGLYPLMGQDVYWLAAPVFNSIQIRLGQTGSLLRIEADFESPDSRYIVGAELNGVPLNRAWIRHGEIAAGGTLRLRAADRPGTWGAAELPPA